MTPAEEHWFVDQADQVDPSALSAILHNPVFKQAAMIVLAGMSSDLPTGQTAIQDAALRSAFEAGMREFPKRLKILATPKKEPTPPKPQPRPYGHYTEERSAFAGPVPVKKPTQPETK